MQRLCKSPGCDRILEDGDAGLCAYHLSRGTGIVAKLMGLGATVAAVVFAVLKAKGKSDGKVDDDE